MKIAIIGGGVSGLYLAYRLMSQDNDNHSVTIFEKSNRLGGRVHTCSQTINGNKVSYEAGAGRYNDSHTLLVKLLKELGLKDKAYPIGFQRSFLVNSQRKSYDKIVGDLLFDKIMKSYKEYDSEYLKSVTLRDFMVKVIGQQKTQNVIDAFGYNSEFELQNAYTSLKIFETDFNDNIQYYGLSGGLSQITDSLSRCILNKNNNRILLQTEVLNYNPVTNIIEWKKVDGKQSKKDTFDKVVFCVTKQALLQFPSLMKADNRLHQYLTHSIEMSPLHRIFATFPLIDGKPWFHGLNRTTTNLRLRYFIPLNPSTGLIQISYTDKQFADYWNSFQNDDDVKKELMKDLKTMFPHKDIPDPTWLERQYWKEGATYWLPNYKRYNNKKDSTYYVCGEMTSQFHNAWIEGSLESVERVVKYLL